MSLSRRQLLAAAFATVPLSLAGGSLLFTSACDIKPQEDADRQQVLRDLVANVMVPTYGDLADATAALTRATTALRQAPSTQTLAAAQQAYRTARAHLEASQAFWYGPADDPAVTSGIIDATPLDGPKADGPKLEALIAGTGGVTPADVGRLGAAQRGFPALEYLLFDTLVGDSVLLERFTSAPRRAELAESIAADLAAKCQAVASGWSGPEGYARALSEAGVDSTTFRTQAEGIDKVVTGLVALTEVMVMRKLAKPLGAETGVSRPELEEAPHSDLSLEDLRNNLLGIQAVYTGQRGDKKGMGLAEPVRAMNPKYAEDFEQALAGAFAALDAVPPPLRVALVSNRPAVEALLNAVRAVRHAIIMELASALGASIGFGFSDTD